MNLGDLMVSLSNHEVAAPVFPTSSFDRAQDEVSGTLELAAPAHER